jgi:hypothetical protein
VTNRVTVTHTANFDRWVVGMGRVAAGSASESGEQKWDEATAAFYAATQQVVHVISGALRASGRYTVVRDGDRLVGQVEYGGGSADYAEYERRRGGEHDFMQRGWLMSEQAFAGTMPLIWLEIQRTWS